jgi:outer membrane immunogenic protein
MRLIALLGTTAVAAIAITSANAADLPARKAAPMLSPVSITNWTGFYVGGHLGFQQGRSALFDPAGAGGPSYDVKGFIGGGQIGYNYQVGAWVFGIEGDFSGSGTDGSTVFRDATTNDLDEDKTKVLWTSLVTGRIGYAIDRALIYGKGGVAFAGLQLDMRDFTNGGSSTGKVTRTGWTVGAGIEYALNTNWSVRGEYDFVQFTRGGITQIDNTGAAATPGISQNLHQFKTSVNYRFGAF